MTNLLNQSVYLKSERRKRSKAESSPWAQYGSDAGFLEWTTHQPSILDGTFNQYNPDRNIACHVRRQNLGAGMGKKPSYSAVAMTDEQHKVQSIYGESSAIASFHPHAAEILGKDPSKSTERARAWFEEQRLMELDRWKQSEGNS